MRNTWEGINDIVKIKRKKNSQPTSFMINNIIDDDPKRVANEFNKYFFTIANELKSEIYNAGEGFEEFLTDSNPHSFFVRPTNKKEILEIISNLSDGKANGHNSYPNLILKLMKMELAEHLADIINLSLKPAIILID